MALAQYYLVSFIFIHCYATVSTIDSFVTPSKNITCPAQPCLTLDEYARSADQFFRDNTTFHFLSGSHQLDTKLRLENVSNVVFTVFENDTVIHLTPLVNITWSDCSNTEVNGIVFILSGGDSIVDPLFSALVFQRTSCFLSQLILLGNRSMQSTAIRTHSSQVKISDVMVLGATSLYGAALVAFNSTIDFLGHNIFINNTAAQGGAIYFLECLSNTFGNITFINNSATTYYAYPSIPQGGAIYSYDSSLFFSGSSWFQRNQATGSPYSTLTYYASDGAVSLTSSTLTFHPSSETTFLENTAILIGGVMTVFSSELIMLGTALFKNNSAGFVGGAIMGGGSNSRIHCRGRNITFQNNLVYRNGSGGAIYADSTIVKLEEVLFEGNVAGSGGAIYSAKSHLQISTCKFVNNTATICGGAVYNGADTIVVFDGVNNFRSNIAPIAGALGTYNTNITFMEENNFINNTGSLGSGCLEIIQSNASICGTSVFYNNHGINGGVIYGIRFGILICGNSSFVSNTADIQGGAIMVTNGTLNITGQVYFFKNKAGSIGSILYAKHSIINISGHAMISESDSLGDQLQDTGRLYGAIGVLRSWMYVPGVLILTNNSGYEGGAISIRYSEVDFKGCVQMFKNRAKSNGGAVYAINSVIMLRESNNCSYFQDNTASIGGAVFAVDSSVHMTGTQNFRWNFAKQGGAMAYSGSSRLILGESLQANFDENQAVTNGGTIYYADSVTITQCTLTNRLQQRECLRDSSQCSDEDECFIELKSHTSNIQLNFINNSAGSAGTVLYGGRLDKCILYVGEGVRDSCNKRTGGTYVDKAVYEIQSISNIVSTDNLTSDISSDPLQVCICTGDSLECQHQQLETVRGKEFILLAVIVGQNNGVVPSAVRTSLENNVQISATQRIQYTGKVCTPITYRLFNENSTTLVLFPDDGPCRDTTLSQRRVEIKFLPCPDGFTLDGFECVCEDRLQRYTSSCNVEDNSIQRYSNTFWMGTIFDNETFEGFILHPGCPFDYCIDYPVSVNLDNIDIQCNHNHTGHLCGSCKDNYSIAFDTLHCLPCSDDYLALIIPFALAGIVLVIILLLLQLSVATGMINGLIFYANVIQANRSIFFPPGSTNILTVFIAWLNLDLGIETCFFDGMNVYAFTWLQFLFPFYVWFLIGLIIIVSRHSSKISRSLGTNPIAALATLFLLSYSKLLRTVIAVLSFTSLEYPDGSHRLVWLYDGNVPYFQRTDHIVLGIFAITVLLFLFLPYTSLLLFGHWLQGCSHWWIFTWLNKIKPFMNAYHAPYKKESRYWTGFILLIRCILFLTFAFNTLGNAGVNLLAITSVTAGLAILAWLRNRVYDKFHNDILESAFVLNLCIFAVATYHVNVSGGSQAALSNVSVGIAFTTFIGIMVYHIFLNLRKTSSWKKLPKPNITECYKNVMSKIHSKKKRYQLGQPNNQNQENLNVAVPTTITIDLNELVI